MLDWPSTWASRTLWWGKDGEDKWLKDNARKHHAESQDSGWERSAAPGQAVSQLCLLLTKEVLFSGWRELPLLLYEVVEALPLEVPSPFSSSTAGQKPRTWYLSGMWNGTEHCWLERSLSAGCVLHLCRTVMHSPGKAVSLLFFIYFFLGMYVY